MFNRHRLGPWLAATTLWLAGCGGSSGTGSGSEPATGPGTQTPGPTAVAFTAAGSSDRTASLAWTAPVATATWTVERRNAGGDWQAVARVDARSGGWLDSGLAPLTDHDYRLVDDAGTHPTLAQGSVRTGNESPVFTPVGAAQGDAVVAAAGPGGARWASPDGAIAIDVPAGTFASMAGATLQPVLNTAPDGRGAGLKVTLDAAPSAALGLTLHYDAAEDAEADGQRIAVQRPDGSWLSLPLRAIDRTARTLTAELPVALLAPAAAPAGAMRSAAVSISIEFTVVRYLAFHLEPKKGRVAVGKTLDLKPYARVWGFEIMIETCLPSDPSTCVVAPMMEARELPILNSKAGYDRRWNVFADEGGNTTDGTVAAGGSTGAVFTAPATVPDPSTVLVTFHSRNLANGRTATLTSQVEITPDRWVGTMTAVIGPSSAGTTYTNVADLSWDYDAGASTATRKVYRASGNLGAKVTDDDCTVTLTPTSQAVSTDPAFVELAVDESRSPAAYTLRVVTFWPATIYAVCPKGSGPGATQTAGYGWDVSGTVSADGSRIEGRRTDANGAQVDWSFTRPGAP